MLLLQVSGTDRGSLLECETPFRMSTRIPSLISDFSVEHSTRQRCDDEGSQDLDSGRHVEPFCLSATNSNFVFMRRHFGVGGYPRHSLLGKSLIYAQHSGHIFEQYLRHYGFVPYLGNDIPIVSVTHCMYEHAQLRHSRSRQHPFKCIYLTICQALQIT